MSNCPSSRGQGSGSRRRRRVYKSPKNREKERRWGRSVKNKYKQTNKPMMDWRGDAGENGCDWMGEGGRGLDSFQGVYSK